MSNIDKLIHKKVKDSIYLLSRNRDPGKMYWNSTDSEKHFKRNWKTKRDTLLENGYDDKTIIEYSYNNYGFRTDEFNQIGDCFITLGCSYTEGIGVDIKHTYGHYLEKELNLKCYNLGWESTGSCTVFMIANLWIPILKPKYVFYLEIFQNRFELLTKDRQPLNLRTDFLDPRHRFRSTSFNLHWSTNIKDVGFINHKINADRTNIALQHICNENKSKLIIDGDGDEPPPIIDFGRDLQHAGRIVHRHWANRMLNRL